MKTVNDCIHTCTLCSLFMESILIKFEFEFEFEFDCVCVRCSIHMSQAHLRPQLITTCMYLLVIIYIYIYIYYNIYRVRPKKITHYENCDFSKTAEYFVTKLRQSIWHISIYSFAKSNEIRIMKTKMVQPWSETMSFSFQQTVTDSNK